MGAGQSGDRQDQPEIRTSYYVLLDVERNATDDEIRKAYRRKALALHPDRNYGNIEAATAQFADVQTAYEVLSDPHERAWYDSHESQILRGADLGDDDGTSDPAQTTHYERNVRLTTAAELAAVILKFNVRTTDFSDLPTGFYGFLRNLFDDLTEQEAAVAAAASAADRSKRDVLVPAEVQAEVLNLYPSFGLSTSDPADVRAFYGVWSSFATRRSYAWVDRYQASRAPDRRTRRHVEKENQRARGEAAREFNESVRVVVEFAKRRDPRWKAAVRTDSEREEEGRRVRAAQRERARRDNEERLRKTMGGVGEGEAEAEVVPEWARSRSKGADANGSVGAGGAVEAGEEEWEEEEVVDEEFECVACGKVFKSDKQFEAHEKSKKHQKAVKNLQREMRAEDDELSLKGQDIATEHKVTAVADNDDDGPDVDSIAASVEDLELSSTDDTDDDDGVDLASTPEDDEDDDAANNQEETHPDDLTSTTDTQDTPASSTLPAPKIGKAAQKRARKAAAAATTTAASTTNAGRRTAAGASHIPVPAAAAAEAAVGGGQFVCAVCQAGFPSKTRMFQHIHDFGHAALASHVKGTGGGGPKGGKKGGRRK